MSLHNKKTYFFVLIVASFIPFAHAQGQESLYNKGVEELKRGSTKKAISIFEEIHAQGYESAELYNNLGTSYMQENKIGLAVLNYETAIILKTNNPQILENSTAVKNKVKKSSQNMQDDVITFFLKSLLFTFTIDEFAIVGINLLVFGLCLMTLYLRIKNFRIKQVGFGFLFISIFALTAACLQYYFRININRAVVIAPKLIVKNAPSFNAKTILTLNEGETVKLQDNFDGWYKVSWAKNKNGWVKESSLKKIILL
ncbi:hypothetical protein AAE02nite_18250 [Adhaeribacter aerolatus]|uniref:SH3b domain-containing protein n=1 Tax=Adhaeribacter aerolatus TaxID=670289 RepID=A0A512AWR4_9BACT|nr:hypothetical protein [Adhaeribacter aerolatus]GEO04161.1 hypothetical protein AAE02nite_18250 [Adhaeribacter aerolatus]